MFSLARNLVMVTIVAVVLVLAFKPGDGMLEGMREEPRGQSRVAAVKPQQSPLINQLVLKRRRDGHYYVTAEVEGVPVDFLVDTGASMIALTYEDAERIGLRPAQLDYSMRAQTANGVALFAPVTLEDVAIEQLEIDDVRAAVAQSDMGMSLLGMSFLGRVDRFEVEDGDLILYW